MPMHHIDIHWFDHRHILHNTNYCCRLMKSIRSFCHEYTNQRCILLIKLSHLMYVPTFSCSYRFMCLNNQLYHFLLIKPLLLIYSTFLHYWHTWLKIMIHFILINLNKLKRFTHYCYRFFAVRYIESNSL